MVAYYNRVLAPLGLTAQQVMALGVLYREEPLSLGVFAERAGIGKAAAVAMVKRLEALGMASREPHPTDARLNEIRLTGKAHRMLPEIARKMDDLEAAVEAAIGRPDLEKITRGLTVIRDLEL
jgi:DNA-binding MarR family transcriptional regulator